MNPIDTSNAQCLVFTYKEGLLSRIAHDLKLKVSRFEITGDLSTSVHARFAAASIHAVCAMKGGQERAMSTKDLREIDRGTQKNVLDTRRYPDIVFESKAIREAGTGLVIEGVLTLHGVTRELRAIGQREGAHLVVTTELHQPDFGIKPFSAALGALKVKPGVTVRLVLPLL